MNTKWCTGAFILAMFLAGIASAADLGAERPRAQKKAGAATVIKGQTPARELKDVSRPGAGKGTTDAEATVTSASKEQHETQQKTIDNLK